MKLKPGQVVYIGKEKFTGEIPDEKAKKAGLMTTKITKTTKKEEVKDK